ncbi:MAG: Ig-like domain-containing protein [Myxococcota bacterium]|nr:Ig-like domain-containing protein [Myxococcota bacterium]
MRRGLPAAFGALLCCAACDVPPDRAPESGPVVLGADPADGEVGVDRAGPFRVFFDRPLFPNDVHRGRVSLQSGSRGVFLAPSFDPVERLLVVAPQATLDPAAVYRLELEGLRDLGGRPMDDLVITFETGEDASEPPVEAPVAWADVAPIFAGCAESGCHDAEAPALGLDLSSADAVARTAIGVPATQVAIGAREDRVWYGAASLDGLARIDVVAGRGRPARSYLIYKVLGDPHVAGERMPPAPAAALPPADLRRLANWILSGAPTG